MNLQYGRCCIDEMAVVVGTTDTQALPPTDPHLVCYRTTDFAVVVHVAAAATAVAAFAAAVLSAAAIVAAVSAAKGL